MNHYCMFHIVLFVLYSIFHHYHRFKVGLTIHASVGQPNLYHQEELMSMVQSSVLENIKNLIIKTKNIFILLDRYCVFYMYHYIASLNKDCNFFYYKSTRNASCWACRVALPYFPAFDIADRKLVWLGKDIPATSSTSQTEFSWNIAPKLHGQNCGKKYLTKCCKNLMSKFINVTWHSGNSGETLMTLLK